MIEINNLTKFRADRRLFTGVAKKVLKGENKEREKISLAFLKKEEIKKLNSKFRKKNKATDVLSFRLDDGDYLGEIVICPDIVKENAKKDGVSAKKEMIKVFIHGILHLLGYDHEISKEEALQMDEKQNLYLSKF